MLNTTTPTLEATYGTAVQAPFELVPLDGSAEPDIGSTQAGIAGHSSGRSATVVLTGDEWAPVASNVAAGALAWDEEYGEDPDAPRGGPRYWKVLDRISAQLGGPAHPLRAE